MQVKIVNPLPQLVSASVVGADGSLVEIKLAGRAESEPVDESTVSEHTRQLVAQRRLKLRPVQPA